MGHSSPPPLIVSHVELGDVYNYLGVCIDKHLNFNAHGVTRIHFNNNCSHDHRRASLMPHRMHSCLTGDPKARDIYPE